MRRYSDHNPVYKVFLRAKRSENITSPNIFRVTYLSYLTTLIYSMDDNTRVAKEKTFWDKLSPEYG